MVGMMVGDLKPIDVGDGGEDYVEEIGAEEEGQMQNGGQDQKAGSAK